MDEDIVLEEELEEPETPETEEEEEDLDSLPVEEQNKRLRDQVKKFGTEISGLSSMVEEIRQGRQNAPAPRAPAAEPVAQPAREISEEEQERINAEFLVEFNTRPDKALARLADGIRRTIRAEFEAEQAPHLESDSDDIIDRYVDRWKKDNPTIGAKVEKIFRTNMDEISPKERAVLARKTPAERKKILDLHMGAAGFEYVKSRMAVKPVRSPSTPAGNRSMGERQEAPSNFRFTETQKAVMRSKGLDDKKIAEQEKRLAGTK